MDGTERKFSKRCRWLSLSHSGPNKVDFFNSVIPKSLFSPFRKLSFSWGSPVTFVYFSLWNKDEVTWLRTFADNQQTSKRILLLSTIFEPFRFFFCRLRCILVYYTVLEYSFHHVPASSQYSAAKKFVPFVFISLRTFFLC